MTALRKDALIVVVGPTASGKTALAVSLAKELRGEVVSADSMQVYRGMDIATAKPSIEEQQGIPHHLLDILEPGEKFSVADYAALARGAIDDIHSRGRVPILAGGTGLYVKAIVDHIQYDGEAVQDVSLREKLRELAGEEGNIAVWNILQGIDPETASALHPNNLGRVIRAIEVYRTSGRSIGEQVKDSRREPCPYHCCQIGLRFHDREILYRRINERVDEMLKSGLLDEAADYFRKDSGGTAAQAIGYKELGDYFAGNCALDEAVVQLKMETRRYAKRQLTWFGRDERIHWIEPDALPFGESVFNIAMKIIQENCGG